MSHFESPNDLSNTPASSDTSRLFPGMAFNQNMFGRQEVQVEKLQMDDLLKNPIVQQMVAEAIDNATYQKKLFKEMSELREEINKLKNELARWKEMRPT